MIQLKTSSSLTVTPYVHRIIGNLKFDLNKNRVKFLKTNQEVYINQLIKQMGLSSRLTFSAPQNLDDEHAFRTSDLPQQKKDGGLIGQNFDQMYANEDQD